MGFLSPDLPFRVIQRILYDYVVVSAAMNLYRDEDFHDDGIEWYINKAKKSKMLKLILYECYGYHSKDPTRSIFLLFHHF